MLFFVSLSYSFQEFDEHFIDNAMSLTAQSPNIIRRFQFSEHVVVDFQDNGFHLTTSFAVAGLAE